MVGDGTLSCPSEGDGGGCFEGDPDGLRVGPSELVVVCVGEYVGEAVVMLFGGGDTDCEYVEDADIVEVDMGETSGKCVGDGLLMGIGEGEGDRFSLSDVAFGETTAIVCVGVLLGVLSAVLRVEPDGLLDTLLRTRGLAEDCCARLPEGELVAVCLGVELGRKLLGVVDGTGEDDGREVEEMVGSPFEGTTGVGPRDNFVGVLVAEDPLGFACGPDGDTEWSGVWCSSR